MSKFWRAGIVSSTVKDPRDFEDAPNLLVNQSKRRLHACAVMLSV